MAMVPFTVWGAARKLGLSDGRVLVRDGERIDERVVARLERDSGLSSFGGATSDGIALENGEPVAHYYHVTLGRPARNGGLNVEGEVWFSVPAK